MVLFCDDGRFTSNIYSGKSQTFGMTSLVSILFGLFGKATMIITIIWKLTCKDEVFVVHTNLRYRMVSLKIERHIKIINL